MPDTNQIFKLHRVIDSAGRTIGYPEEVEIVVEVQEIVNG
jgi:hypothetical protein